MSCGMRQVFQMARSYVLRAIWSDRSDLRTNSERYAAPPSASSAIDNDVILPAMNYVSVDGMQLCKLSSRRTPPPGWGQHPAEHGRWIHGIPAMSRGYARQAVGRSVGTLNVELPADTPPPRDALWWWLIGMLIRDNKLFFSVLFHIDIGNAAIRGPNSLS